MRITHFTINILESKMILFSSLIDSPLIIFKYSDGMIYFPNVDSLILLLMFVCIFLSVIMMMAGLIRP